MSWSSAAAGLALCAGIAYAVRPLKFYENPDADISGTSLIKSGLSKKYEKKLLNFVAAGSKHGPQWVFTDNRGGVYTVYWHKRSLNVGANRAVFDGTFRYEKFVEWLAEQPD